MSEATDPCRLGQALLRSAGAVIFAGALLGGCTKDDPPASESSATEASPRASLKVVEAGAEPRRTLAYAPEGGERAPSIRWEMKRSKEGEPAIGYEIGLRWQIPSEAGGPWRFGVRGIEHLDPTMKDMADGERAIVGSIDAMFEAVQGQGSLAAGVPTFEQTVGVSTQPSLPAVLEMLAVPLPSEPVGVGARWEVVTPDQEGSTPRVYELIALDQERATIRTTQQTTRGAFQESVEGTMSIGFGDLLPIEAKVEVRQSNEMTPPSGEDTPSEPVRFEMGFDLQLR